MKSLLLFFFIVCSTFGAEDLNPEHSIEKTTDNKFKMMEVTKEKLDINITESTSNSSLKFYVLFGLPGAGKGTCSQALKERKNYEHLSLGDYLRKEVTTKSEIGVEYREQILSGLELVPSYIVEDTIKEKFLRSISEKQSLIIDGFPRTLEQVEFLNSLTKEININPCYVYIKVDPELSIKRLLTREACNDCGHVYMIIPPKREGICDLCEGSLFKRITDDRDTILKRMNFFKTTTQNVIDFYIQENMMITIDANKPLTELVEEFIKFDDSF